jgi:hypothetical protein
MAVKPRFNDTLVDKANERADKQLARIYVVWLLGIIVGAIQLKVEKIEYGGISFVVDQTDTLQGLVYVLCVVMYVGLFGSLLMFSTQYLFTQTALKRRILYAALDSKKSLINRPQRDLIRIKTTARFYYRCAFVFLGSAALLPLLHIMFLQQSQLFQGIDVIFHSSSFKDGRLNLLASAPALLTLIMMAEWTAIIHKRVHRRAAKSVGSVYFVNGVALGTFTVMDWYFRGVETISHTFIRLLLLQIVIVLLYTVPTILALPFRIWFWIRRRFRERFT